MKTKGNIILIEDDRSVLSAIGRILEREGYDVRGFFDPLTAVESLAKDTHTIFDLIIIDINLPAIDGFDTSIRLRELPGFADIPIIFISAIHTSAEEMIRGLSLGAVDYIIKPFEPDIFLKKVETFVTLKQSMERIEALRLRYHLLFEEYNDPTFILDRAGTILEANGAARTILGIAPEDRLPALIDLIHPDDKQTALDMIKNLSKNIGPQNPRLIRMKNQQGTYLFMEINGGAFISDAMPDSIHLTARDITERITLTAGLELLYRTSRRLSSVLDIDGIFPIITESIHDAVAADRIGIVTLEQDDGAVIRATTKTQTEGFHLPHPIDLSHYPEYRKVIEEKRPLHIADAGAMPILVGEKDRIARARVTSVLLVPIVMDDRVYGIIHLARYREIRPFLPSEIEVLMSVADLAALALKNALLFLETKKNEQFKSHLINVFTHEVGTPLGTIMGYTQLLMEAMGNDKKNLGHLRAVLSETDRLKVLMENFLDITRLRSGKIRPKRDTIPPNILMQKVFRDFVDSYQHKGVDLSLVPCPDNLKIEGDLTLLESALSNLVKNALKYTPSGGSVTMTGAAHRNTAALSPPAIPRNLGTPLFSITVADTGIGVPPLDRARIFEEFYRGANLPPGEKGAGLGLTIVKEVIEAHGGIVRLIASEKGGSAFQIILPVKG